MRSFSFSFSYSCSVASTRLRIWRTRTDTSFWELPSPTMVHDSFPITTCGPGWA